MKKVSYNDPYEEEQVIVLVEDDADNLEETMAFLKEDTRKTQNLERKERYHNRFPLFALKYEGMNYAFEDYTGY